MLGRWWVAALHNWAGALWWVAAMHNWAGALYKPHMCIRSALSSNAILGCRSTAQSRGTDCSLSPSFCGGMRIHKPVQKGAGICCVACIWWVPWSMKKELARRGGSRSSLPCFVQIAARILPSISRWAAGTCYCAKLLACKNDDEIFQNCCGACHWTHVE